MTGWILHCLPLLTFPLLPEHFVTLLTHSETLGESLPFLWVLVSFTTKWEHWTVVPWTPLSPEISGIYYLPGRVICCLQDWPHCAIGLSPCSFPRLLLWSSFKAQRAQYHWRRPGPVSWVQILPPVLSGFAVLSRPPHLSLCLLFSFLIGITIQPCRFGDSDINFVEIHGPKKVFSR